VIAVMLRRTPREPTGPQDARDAVFLYMGILDAYEAVGRELIGPDVLDVHVLPRMVYYVKEFLPEIFSEESNPDQLVTELRNFLQEFRRNVDRARQVGSAQNLSMEDIWKLRAAIFGFESVFIKILGDAAIKNYLFARIADILSSYLPQNLLDPRSPLEKKLTDYANYIRNNKFVKYARVTVGEDAITVVANKCAFAKIHDSDAYRSLHVRFCPWGMIASAIVAAHEGKETNLQSSTFTTRGSVSRLKSR